MAHEYMTLGVAWRYEPMIFQENGKEAPHREPLHDRLTSLSSTGWEPSLMTAVGKEAVLVVLRRPIQGSNGRRE